ncbi:hypothetical protein J6590_053451 [Homalodisca vitripennis]|nr:hypothetical protein J6590_053451 [Homalodisca vitripennis]
MTAEQINAAFPAQKIYVSEHLTPENKMFLSKLKNKCKESGYKFAWCKDGKFFVRKCEGERFIRIENDEELNKLKNQQPSYLDTVWSVKYTHCRNSPSHPCLPKFLLHSSYLSR